MLQKYPDIAERVEFVVSFVGFGRSADFAYKPLKSYPARLGMSFGASAFGGRAVKTLVFNGASLRLMFKLFELFNPKYRHDTAEARRAATEMELELWRRNDARTRFYLYRLLGDFDLTKSGKKLPLKLHNLSTGGDQYLDAERVKKTLNLLYEKVKDYRSPMPLHAPSIIGTEDEVAEYFPAPLKKVLSR